MIQALVLALLFLAVLLALVQLVRHDGQDLNAWAILALAAALLVTRA